MSKADKIKMYKVSCMQENCPNGFYIFRPDDKTPVEGIRCIPCEIKKRQESMPTRTLKRHGSNYQVISVGSSDEADKKLVRCE